MMLKVRCDMVLTPCDRHFLVQEEHLEQIKLARSKASNLLVPDDYDGSTHHAKLARDKAKVCRCGLYSFIWSGGRWESRNMKTISNMRPLLCVLTNKPRHARRVQASISSYFIVLSVCLSVCVTDRLRDLLYTEGNRFIQTRHLQKRASRTNAWDLFDCTPSRVSRGFRHTAVLYCWCAVNAARRDPVLLFFVLVRTHRVYFAACMRPPCLA